MNLQLMGKTIEVALITMVLQHDYPFELACLVQSSGNEFCVRVEFCGLF